MLTKEGYTKILNCMTPGRERGGGLVLRRGHIIYIVKMHCFFENLLFSQAQIRQSKNVVMLNKEVSTKILNCMTPGTGVLELTRGHISHAVKMHYSF